MLTKIKYFRRLYYNKLIEYVESSEKTVESGEKTSVFLCYYHYDNALSHLLLGRPCWRDMKEVIENNRSSYVVFHHRGNLNCEGAMFNNNSDRIAFLKECIALMDKN
jgi:hypothetical protein